MKSVTQTIATLEHRNGVLQEKLRAAEIQIDNLQAQAHSPKALTPSHSPKAPTPSPQDPEPILSREEIAALRIV